MDNSVNSVLDDARELVSLHRLNGEPIIILGFTKSELKYCIALATLLCIPAAVFVMTVLGHVRQGLPIGLLLSLFLVVVIGMWLGRIKRQRPAGYYQQRLQLALQDFGLLNSGFIRHAQVWDHYRHR